MSKERLLCYVEKLYAITDGIQKKLQNKNSEGTGTRKITGTDFEEIVYDSLIEAGFDEKSITHRTQKFPDFVLMDMEDGDKIGIEVKKTDTSKWEVLGGSIYESLKNDINDTYVLMAKLGGNEPEVRLRKYEECIADLKVTHSPRFYLNLDLKEGEDYLTRNDANNLLELSGDDLHKKIRQLLRTQKSTWWSEGKTVSFSDLSQEEKGSYLNEGIALFPEVFNGVYKNFTPWLVYSCFVWCGNVRDIFSAGGNVFIEDTGIYVSAIMNRALANANSIKKRIFDMTNEEQEKFWGKVTHQPKERLEIWIGLVEDSLKISTDLTANNKKLPIFENFDDTEIRLAIKKSFISRLRYEMNSGSETHGSP